VISWPRQFRHGPTSRSTRSLDLCQRLRTRGRRISKNFFQSKGICSGWELGVESGHREPLQHFNTASEVASIGARCLATAQRAAPRPASFFNSRPELAEMKLYPARPTTR